MSRALRQNFPFGMFAVPREQVVRVHASSGTTGKPTVIGATPIYMLNIIDEMERQGIDPRSTSLNIGVACQSGQVFPLTEGMTGTVVARRAARRHRRAARMARPGDRCLHRVQQGRAPGVRPGRCGAARAVRAARGIVLATARLREAAEVSARAEAVAAQLSQAAGQLRTASRQAMDALAKARLTLLGLAAPAVGAPSADTLAVGGPPWDGPSAGPRLRVLIAANRPLPRRGTALGHKTHPAWWSCSSTNCPARLWWDCARRAILSAPALAQLQRGLREDAVRPTLTERERQVRGLIEQGLPDKVIAERLVLSVKTVEKHAGAVLRYFWDIRSTWE